MRHPWGEAPLPPILETSWEIHLRECAPLRDAVHRGLRTLLLKPERQVTLVRYHYRLLVFQPGQEGPCLAINLESTNLEDPVRRTQALGAHTSWGHMYLGPRDAHMAQEAFLELALATLDEFLDPESFRCRQLIAPPPPLCGPPDSVSRGSR